MYFRLVCAFVFSFLLLSNGATAQRLAHDIPYVENGHKRQVLDVYTPENRPGESLPVMFWIHGGGWQAGDKSDVALSLDDCALLVQRAGGVSPILCRRCRAVRRCTEISSFLRTLRHNVEVLTQSDADTRYSTASNFLPARL